MSDKYPPITLIAAIDTQNGIGKNNQLLCHISADLKRFKEITSGHTIIMGKHTYLSLPKRPLPNRKHIVLSNSLQIVHLDVEVVSSAIEAIKKMSNDKENFIIGGGMIYNEFIVYAQRLLITKIHAIFEADTFFPDISGENWELTEQSELFYDENSDISYEFLTYERK
jgi:dihydrofolate reductase